MLKRCIGCMECFDGSLTVCPHCGYAANAPAEEAIHMSPRTILHDRYVVGKVLGYGGFGVTYIGWDGLLEQKVAIKEYLPGEFSTRMPGQTMVTVFNDEKGEQFFDGMRKFIEEARHLAKFQNEDGIVKVFDSFEENDTAYIVMEYLEGETLTEYLKRSGIVPESAAINMLLPIMKSLQVVHEEGLIHRDIAPDNIFLCADGKVKLIDFGASRYATTSHSRSLTVIIKPGYSPEEQYRSRSDQGPHTDVYAIAATLYKMITGKTPPDAMERRAKFESTGKETLVAPHKIIKSITPAHEVAILNAMNVRIEDRTPDIATLVSELMRTSPAKRRSGKIGKIDLYRWPKWLKITVPAVLAAIMMVVILMATGVIKTNFKDNFSVPNGYTRAPDIYNMSEEDAVKLIRSKGLKAYLGGREICEYIETGTVYSQNPIAGTLIKMNGMIIYYISDGTGEITGVEDGKATVPSVRGRTQEEAEDVLLQAGFVVNSVIEEKNDEVLQGIALRITDMDGNELAESSEYDEGTEVILVISSGPELINVPNVIGQPLNNAVETINAEGFVCNADDAIYKYSQIYEKGIVIAYTPNKGIPGSEVILTVSNGAEPTISSTSESSEYNNESTTIAVTDEITEETVYTITFDANGGSSYLSSKNVTYGEMYGDLPEATRDYFNFDGWYTDRIGGSRVTSSTIYDVNFDITLYAHWSENSISDWVPESSVPSGAQIVYTEWRFTQRETTESSNSSMSGWTLYDKQRTSWGSKQGPVYSDPSNGSRKVVSEEYVKSTTTHYTYYHRYGWGYNISTGQNGYVWGSDTQLPNGSRHSIDLTYQLTEGSSFAGSRRWKGYRCPDCGESNIWLGQSTYNVDNKATRWYYYEPIYTYYFYRDVQKTSDTDPSGSSNVSNVVKYVKYRLK